MEKEITKYFDMKLNTIDNENEHYFYVKVLNTKELPIPQKKTIILLIDKSGSMEGENITHTKKVIKKLLYFFRENMKDASINLIIFDSRQNVIKEANKISKTNIDKLIDNIKADDCTYFSGVLQSMSDFIKNKKTIDDLTIIFMTDGKIEYDQDVKDNNKLLNQKLEDLKKSIQTHVKQVDIHAIGLGKGHDPYFLERVIDIKPVNSSFQFIINETGIDPSFNAVKDMIFANNIQGQLILSDADNTDIIDLALSESEGEEGKRVWECLSKTHFNINNVNKNESYVAINLSNGTIQERFYLKDIYRNNSNQESAYKIHLAKIREDLNVLFNSLKISVKDNKSKISELDEYTKQKEKLRNLYQNVAIKLYKVKEQDLKTYLFKLCEEISPVFGVIEEILTAAYKNQVKSEILGKAIQLAHKNIKKKKYIDELESRLPTTVRLFNKQDEIVKSISQNVNKEELYKKYPTDVIENYKCFLTCNDFIEAISEGDCICLTFGISRTEQAIVVPSTIKVTNIYPTIISAQSFMNSIKYSINLNFEQNSEKNEQVIIGEARESINGALPIFLNEDHWQISSILMDRILGWIVTLDPMGYHINQKMTFPYILLEYVIEELYKKPDSTFMKNYFKLISDTCIHLMIYEDSKDNSGFKNNYQKLFDSYLNTGAIRTPDSVSKNSFFFLKLYCSIILSWVKISDKVFETFFHLIEEELRRTQSKIYQNYADYVNLDITNEEIFTSEEEKQKVIDKYVDECADSYLKNCRMIRIILYLISNYPDGNIDFKNIKVNEDKYAVLSDLKLESKLALYALFFQNQLHHDSSVRKKAFNDNLYIDPRASNFMDIFNNYGKNIKEIKEKRLKQLEGHNNIENIDENNLRKKFRNVEVIKLLHEFRLTENIEEAKQLLDMALLKKPGRGVHYYFNIFYGCSEIPLLLDKLMLLKENHKSFKRAIKCKHVYDLCYSNVLDLYDLVSVFGLQKIPRSLRIMYKSLHK